MMHCLKSTVHTKSASGKCILQNIVNSVFASKFYWRESSRLLTHRHWIISTIPGVQIRAMTPCRTRGPPEGCRLNNLCVCVFLSCSWWESHRLWPVWSSVPEGRCSRGPPADPHRCNTNTNPHCTHQTHSNVRSATVCGSLSLRAHVLWKTFAFNERNYYCA